MGEAADAMDPLGGVGGSTSASLGSGGGSSAGASVSSIGALGLGMYSSITSGQGTQAADEFKADRAERAAQFGRTQASLEDTTRQEQLNVTLGNIDAIRAAGHDDPTSPTGAAVKSFSTMLADRQRTAAVGTLLQQASDDEASADYLRRAGKYAMKQGEIKAGIQAATAVAKMAMMV